MQGVNGMSGLNWGLVKSTVSYWLGALSEPVLMVTSDQMRTAATAGTIIWDVRSNEAHAQGHPDGALSFGSVEWLLADSFGGNLIPAPVIAATLRDAGIEPGCSVIIYSEGSAVDAFVALRALRSIGIPNAQVCLGDAVPAGTPAVETRAEPIAPTVVRQVANAAKAIAARRPAAPGVAAAAQAVLPVRRRRTRSVTPA